MAERLTISDIRQHQRMGGSFHPRSYSASLEDTALAALAEVESLQAQLRRVEYERDDARRNKQRADGRLQTMRDDAAAVRTDLSVARAALEDVLRCSQLHRAHLAAANALGINEASGLRATPPVAQLDP